MKLDYTKPHNLAALHAELLAAIPELGPQPGPSGQDEAVFSLSDNDDAITVWVPDAVGAPPVDAVIAAHTNPPPPDMAPPDFGGDAADMTNYPAIRQWVSNTRTYIGLASPTAAETRAQVERNARAIMAILRRMV